MDPLRGGLRRILGELAGTHKGRSIKFFIHSGEQLILHGVGAHPIHDMTVGQRGPVRGDEEGSSRSDGMILRPTLNLMNHHGQLKHALGRGLLGDDALSGPEGDDEQDPCQQRAAKQSHGSLPLPPTHEIFSALILPPSEWRRQGPGPSGRTVASMAARAGSHVRAARLGDLRERGRLAVQVPGHTLVLLSSGDTIYAVDNRCPHMGFPLDRGTVSDGILTCHWHHARFDLASGGTFDQFADDVRVYPVEVREGEIWVDLAPRGDPRAHHSARLRDGLERDIPLVMAKAVIALFAGDGDIGGPFRIGLEFGARYRQAGWGPGLTIHTCLMNLLPHLDPIDRSRALYHGLSAVARDCDGVPPRFVLRPLPGGTTDLKVLKRWFRQFIEVRDAEGAERCVVSAVRAGADDRQMGDLLFSAATDHRYIQIGHVCDFTNKALEALDHAGWEHAETILASLVSGYASADRMEESNEWRHPVDLIALLERAFEEIPAALDAGRARQTAGRGRETLEPVLLGEDPRAITDALLGALREGTAPDRLAGAVAGAAALRIARFPLSNEFGDWDTALHTFTFANAVHQGLRRTPSPELVRGVFDAAMSVYLDRFLNVPPAPLPEPGRDAAAPADLLSHLADLLDRQQRVDEAAKTIVTYQARRGDSDRLLAVLGHLLLREDRNFHTIQAVEAAIRQHTLRGGAPDGPPLLVAAARYLAAHAPTVRAQDQTFQIASRLARGERLFDNAQGAGDRT
jgi:nitrite reductase/ring-hydroxylating ferredoxin subunit